MRGQDITYPELCHVKGDILVERIQNDTTNSVVTPRPMNKEEFAEITELGNRHIGRPSGLETFKTTNTNTNMCGLNHGHVVRTVTDSEKQGFEVTLHKFDYQGFL